MPYTHVWVFYNRRTNPARVHRFTSDGEPSAVVIHVLKGGDTDADFDPKKPVEDVPMTGAGNTRALTHLPPDWKTADWSNHQWPKGTLFVYQDEYDDPHAVLAEATRKRIAAESGTQAAPAIDVSDDVPEFAPTPGVAPAQEISNEELADTDKSGDVSKKEKREFEAQNPGQTVKKGPIDKG